MPRTSSAAKVQEWAERLERFQSSGLTAAKFCQAENVSLPSFYQWKRKLAARANPQEPTRGSSAFTAIELKPTAPAMTTIRLPNGIAIEFNCDGRMLQRWLQELLQQALQPGSI
jgi:hypothetical protein